MTRFALLVTAALSQMLIPLKSGSAPDPFGVVQALAGWLRWDAGWYLSIVFNGYQFNPRTRVGSVAFYPLFPVLVRVVSDVTGHAPVVALALANIFFVAAMVCTDQLARLKLDSGTAWRSTLLLAVFPYSMFFSSAYAESLLLLLAALSFWLAEHEHWWAAGVAGLLCALTRPTGVFLAPAIFLTYLQHRGYSWKRINRSILSAGLVPVGTLLYMAYLRVRFGNPLASFEASAIGWQHYDVFVSGVSWLNPYTFQPGNYDLILLLNVIVMVIWVGSSVFAWRLLGPGYAAFVFLGAAVPFIIQVESVGRFVAVLFPTYIVAGYALRQPMVFRLVLVASAMALALITALFVNSYWIV